MPIYEYQCQSCGRLDEVMQKMSDPPLTTCEECGGDLKKLISAPAFQFKGDGWYVTDYARKKEGGKGGGKSDSGSEKSSGSKDTSGSNSSGGSSGDSKGGSDKSKSSSSESSS